LQFITVGKVQQSLALDIGGALVQMTFNLKDKTIITVMLFGAKTTTAFQFCLTGEIQRKPGTVSTRL